MHPHPASHAPSHTPINNAMHALRQTLARHIGLGLLSLSALCSQAAGAQTTALATRPDASGADLIAQANTATTERLAIEPSRYTTQTFEWTDAARSRAVPARLYLPVGPHSAGSVPLVVFSHGIGGSKDGYSYLGRYFAANGYASLHVQHVGSDRQLWRGNPLGLVFRLAGAAQEGEALDRVNDVKFALTQLLSDPQGHLINPGRLVAAGHSYGANTTMLLAGARVDVNGTPVAAKDPRFTAAILISAPPFYGLGNPQNIVSGIDVPTLHITATADDIQIPGYNSGVADRLALYQATAMSTNAAKVLAVFKDGSHSIFTDRMGTGGALLNPKIKVATRQLALAFLNALQYKDMRLLERWSGQNTDLLAQFEKSAL